MLVGVSFADLARGIAVSTAQAAISAGQARWQPVAGPAGGRVTMSAVAPVGAGIRSVSGDYVTLGLALGGSPQRNMLWLPGLT